MLTKEHAENISNSPYFCPSMPLEKASCSLCRQRDTCSLWKTLKCLPELLKVRVFVSWCRNILHGAGNRGDNCSLCPQVIFSLAVFWFCCVFPGTTQQSFPFFPHLELSGLASRVTTPLIVLAGWKMVCCSLSVGSLLLNAASGTPEHLDQSIGLSRPYFPHCPHPGDVCNNRREHTNPGVIGYRVRIQTPAASVLRMCVFWWGEQGRRPPGHCLGFQKDVSLIPPHCR